MDLEEFRRQARKGISVVDASSPKSIVGLDLKFEITSCARWLNDTDFMKSELRAWSERLFREGGWGDISKPRPSEVNLEVKCEKSINSGDLWGAKVVVNNERVWFCDIDNRRGIGVTITVPFYDVGRLLPMGGRYVLSENVMGSRDDAHRALPNISTFAQKCGWPSTTEIVTDHDIFKKRTMVLLKSNGGPSGKNYALGGFTESPTGDFVADFPHYEDDRPLFSGEGFLG